MAAHELVHSPAAMLGHDENVEAPLVHPICQLGEHVGMHAGALRYQDVGSVESVEKVVQLQTLVIGMQRCTVSARSTSAGSVEVT